MALLRPNNALMTGSLAKEPKGTSKPAVFILGGGNRRYGYSLHNILIIGCSMFNTVDPEGTTGYIDLMRAPIDEEAFRELSAVAKVDVFS